MIVNSERIEQRHSRYGNSIVVSIGRSPREKGALSYDTINTIFTRFFQASAAQSFIDPQDSDTSAAQAPKSGTIASRRPRPARQQHAQKGYLPKVFIQKAIAGYQYSQRKSTGDQMSALPSPPRQWTPNSR